MVQTMVGDLIPFERRGRASGTIMSAFSLSTVAGVPLSLYLANHFGWRFPFYFIALLSCGLLALGWKMLPELRGHLPSSDVNEEERAHPFSAMFEVLRDANHRRALTVHGADHGLGLFGDSLHHHLHHLEREHPHRGHSH
jgi:predicted MFS family arabinose efflux permease